VAQPDDTQKPDEALPQARGTSLAERVRERWKAPAVTEETRDQPVRAPRSPWREDLPSPRCVLEDYRAGALHYGEGAWLIALGYWAVSAVPMAWNMAAAANHVASQRPGRFWAVVAVLTLLTVCLLAFS
jgi:hypothetical protein